MIPEHLFNAMKRYQKTHTRMGVDTWDLQEGDIIPTADVDVLVCRIELYAEQDAFIEWIDARKKGPQSAGTMEASNGATFQVMRPNSGKAPKKVNKVA